MRWIVPTAGLLSLGLLSCSSQSTPAPGRPEDTLATLQRLGALPATRAVGPALAAQIPRHAAAALRVGDGEVWLEVTPHDLREAATGEVVAGSTVYRDAAPDLDLVYAREPGRVEELRLARTRAAAMRSTWDLRFGPGVATVQVVDGKVEVVDAKGIVRVTTEPAFAIDAAGVRRPLTLALHGRTLEARLDTDGLTAPIAVDPAWVAAASPSGLSRVSATLTKLQSGKVLLAGGQVLTTGDRLSTAEIFDPATNTWKATTNNLARPRAEHTATWFGGTSKKVVLVGGHNGITNETTLEVFDEATTTFAAAVTMPAFPGPSGMSAERRSHGAVAMPTGEVLVVGGRQSSGDHDSMFTVDSNGLVTTMTPKLSVPTRDPNLVVLADGRVLVASGSTSSGGGGGLERYIRSCSIVKVSGPTSTIVPAADLPVGRIGAFGLVPTTGPNAGKALLVGGAITSATSESSTVPSQGGMIYDPVANTWAPLPQLMATKRYIAVGGLLSSGRVIMTGGIQEPIISGNANADAEVLDLVSMTWKSAGKMVEPRAAHQGVVLDDGSMLLVGGVRAVTDGVLTLPSVTAERFTSQPNGADCDSDGQCTSGVCIDRVCCDKACDGQCEACDVAGSRGTCKVVTGAPHGARPACRAPLAGDDPTCAESCNGTDKGCKFAATTVACSANACAAGVETHASTCNGAGKCGDVIKPCGDFTCGTTACKTSCTVKADCTNPAHFCEAGKCIPQQATGSPCARDEACATGICVDGICCETKCDGQCQACDVPGQAGKCVAIKGKPHGLRADCDKDATDSCKSKSCDGTNTASCAATVGPCSPYACDDGEKVCKKACATDVDCGTGYECDKTAKCVPRTSKCIGTDTLQAADGSKTKCEAFVCRDGVCLDKCNTSNDCQNGFACDGAGKCVSASSAPVSTDSGGCSTTGGSSQAPVWLAALALLGLRRRR